MTSLLFDSPHSKLCPLPRAVSLQLPQAEKRCSQLPFPFSLKNILPYAPFAGKLPSPTSSIGISIRPRVS